MGTNIQTKKFLRALWGADQVTAFIGVKTESGFSNQPVSSLDDAVQVASASAADGNDAYMSCALFRNHDSRLAENADFAHGFWLDLDCGPDKTAAGKGYPDKKSAVAALANFCRETRFREPDAVVDSGNGWHVYWLVADAIPATTWKERAEKLKALTHHYGLLADDNRTADLASVLRVPGTLNFKDRDNPKPVKLLRFSGARDNGVTAQIDAAYQAAGSPPLAAARAKIDIGSTKADPAQVSQLIDCMRRRQPELMAGQYDDVVSLGVKVSGYGGDRTAADMALVGETVREAARLGLPDDTLADAAWQVYEASGLYANDEDQADRERKITIYAIPKVLASEIQKRDAARQQFAEAQENEPEAVEAMEGEPGDVLAGRVFANKMKYKLLFVAVRKCWMRWDGQRWAQCECFEEMVAAKHVAGKILDIATAQFKLDSQSPRSKKLMAFATSLQNLKRQQAMLEMAKSEGGMTVGSMTALDADPWLLGVRNGVVSLREGGLLAADPQMLITRQAAAEYRDDAECPRWLEFLDQVFQGDQETIDYLQRALGYTLTGTTREEVLFICFGHGANGKSVFGNVVSTIMADYGQAAPPSLLTARRADDNGARGDIARMCGARLASINELQGGDRLDEQVVKMLAGREQISARFNYGEFFDFWPTAKPWLRTNHKPIITGDDEGIWRRLHLIPFRRKFAENERNPYLEEQLLEERDGILRWMVQGCLAWQRHGLKPSATVRRESAEYRKDSDLLGEFLDDRAVMASQHKVERGAFFTRWRSWCEANGYRAGSQASISRKMTERGFVSAKTNGKRYYTGVGLVVGNSDDPVDLLANLLAEAAS